MKPKTLIEHMRAIEAHTDAAALKAWAADNADAVKRDLDPHDEDSTDIRMLRACYAGVLADLNA